MPEKEKIIMSFIAEMQDTSPDDYMEIKLIMLAVNAGNTVVLNFLRMAFELIEAHRPRLIELIEPNTVEELRNMLQEDCWSPGVKRIFREEIERRLSAA